MRFGRGGWGGCKKEGPRAAAQAAGFATSADEGWEDLFFRLLLEHIEPNLCRRRATFLTHWPASQAALSPRDPAESRSALRFEPLVQGPQCHTSFAYFTDPAE